MNKQTNRRKNFGWLLWIVALIFVQVACGIELTDEEKNTITGSYLQVNRFTFEEIDIYIPKSLECIKLGSHRFKFEKYSDEENLKILSTSLKAKYYLKSNFAQLVVMSDGSIQFHRKHTNPDVLYKIENTQKETRITVDEIIKEKSDAVETETMKKSIRANQFENLANEVDAFLGKYYRRISILTGKPTSSNLNSSISTPEISMKQKLLIITCCIVLIIVMIFLCVQCCRSWNEPNIENLPIEQLKTNDLSDYYPSSTDLVIDVQETGSTQSIQSNINPSDFITTVSSGNLKITSSNLFTIQSIGSEEVNESKSTQTMETNSNQSVSITSVKTTDIKRNTTNLDSSESTDVVKTKPKTTHSESKETRKNTNDTDDFTI